MMGPLDSRIIDINSEALGVSVAELMDNAGRVLADYVAEEFPGKRILIVCGSGNNGGDGLAAAHHLKGKTKVTVALLDPPENIRTDASRVRLAMLRPRPKRFAKTNIEDHDVIVDCVLGVGMNGPLRENVRGYLNALRKFKGSIVSADVPTGFGTGEAVVPYATVTFHDIKMGMDETNSGKIIVGDIGIPADAWETVGPGDMLRYPIPDNNSHKGRNGRLLVIGGGPYIGAPAMSAMASLRTGVDIVRIATPSKSFVPIACMSPSFIMHELPGDVLGQEHLEALSELTERVDCVLIGPGLGRDPATSAAVSEFVRTCRKPMVIDADAIAAAGGLEHYSETPLIFTPHRGELEIMMGFMPSGSSASDYSLKRGKNVIIVSKGKVDEITDGRNARRNTTGTAAMTVGGTGDALAGIIAGLVAKGMEPFDAACLGAYIGGEAGERAFSKYSYGMTAPDMIECIPEVLRESL